MRMAEPMREAALSRLPVGAALLSGLCTAIGRHGDSNTYGTSMRFLLI